MSLNTAQVAFIVAGADLPFVLGWDLLRRRITAPANTTADAAATQPLPVVAPHPPLAPVAALPQPPEPGTEPAADTASVFAANVKALRTARGWTTRDLAGECGLSNSTVTAAENRTGRLYLETAARIAGAFGVPLGEMLGEAAYAREESGRQNLAGIGKESA